MSVNKVILVGNVGKDPEVRHLDNGTAVGSFTLATSESYKNKTGEKVTNTEWHNIVVWRGLAEIVEKYVKKGQQLYIEGKIINRSWDDKEGVKRYTTEIVAENMVMLGRKSDDGNSGELRSSNQYTSQETTSGSGVTNVNEQDSLATSPEDDLPF